MNGLHYVGQGAYLVGVPARNLAEDELDGLAFTREELLRSGIYQEPEAVMEDGASAFFDQ